MMHCESTAAAVAEKGTATRFANDSVQSAFKLKGLNDDFGVIRCALGLRDLTRLLL